MKKIACLFATSLVLFFSCADDDSSATAAPTNSGTAFCIYSVNAQPITCTASKSVDNKNMSVALLESFCAYGASGDTTATTAPSCPAESKLTCNHTMSMLTATFYYYLASDASKTCVQLDSILQQKVNATNTQQ